MCVVYHTLHPAEAVGWNVVPFGRVTHVVPSNSVLDSGSGLPKEGRFGGQNP